MKTGVVPVAEHEVRSMVERMRDQNLVVGLCHGCFDILHIGHLRHFEAASAHCDALIVSVTKDVYVNKGPNRPVFDERIRASLVAGLKPVHATFISPEATALGSIRLVQPSVFFKGQDYADPKNVSNENFFIERDLVQSFGGSVIFTTGETNSSSQTFERIKQSD